MARQKGHIKYVGTIGDVRHFKIKGTKGYFAGLTGGPTAEQIATAPEFARTRENMNEFGGCALVGKSFRQSISGLVKAIGDSQVTGRVTAIMKKINLEDGSEARGKRAILVSQASQYLKGFEFNKNTPFNTVVKVPVTATITPDRLSVNINIPAFMPTNALSIPKGATDFKITHGITVLSDFAFDDNTGEYLPKEPELNGLTSIVQSPYSKMEVEKSEVYESATLDEGIVLTNDVSVVHFVAIEFYQEVNGNFYLLSQGNAMKVNQIF